MASALGRFIRAQRKEQGIGLREFAKMVGKSPSFITQLECDAVAPAVAEETLQIIATKLQINADPLLVLAKRVPKDVFPDSSLELALYRRIKAATQTEQRSILKKLGEVQDRKR